MRTLIIFLLALLPSCLHAQTYEGRVVDSKKKGIDAASVVVYDGTGKTVAYTYTSTDGKFSIDDAEKRGAQIVFTCLGYAKKSLPLSDFSSSRTVVLEKTSIVLQEVKVRPDKIKERGDTLVYDVSMFKQGQDRSIADVIKKMPGLQVAENGQISYEGKAISKFYIEGMDLMGGKYAQASENLKADKVKNVEVIENHQEVKSLRGVDFSDQAALNIVLKDDAKNTWTGVVESGVGVQNAHGAGKMLYDGKLMGMLFGRKMQNLSMYKCNNSGKEIAVEIRDLASLTREFSRPRGLVGAMSVDAPDIGQEQTYFNTSHLAATNQLFKTKKGNDLRIQADYLWNRERADQYSETSYTDIDAEKTIEENSVSVTSSRFNGEISYKVNTDKLYLTNNLYGSLDFNRSIGTTLLNGREITQSVRPRKMYATEEFSLIKTNASGGKLGLSSTTTYSYLPERLLTVLDGTERHNIYTFQHKDNVSYRKRLKRFSLNAQAGFSALLQRMQILGLRADTTEKYQQYDFYLTPSVSYERNSLKLSLSAKFNTALRHYDGENRARVSLQPSVFAQYALNKFFQLKLNYNYSESSHSLLTVFRTPVFTSYRTQRSYGGQITDVGNHLLNLSLSFKQPVKQLFAGISALWMHRHNEMVFQNHLLNNVYLSTPTAHRRNANTYECSLFASHSLYWGRTTIGAEVSFGRSDYTLLHKDELEDWRLNTVDASLKMASQPFRNFSFELSSSLHVSKQMPSGSSEWESTRVSYYKHRVSATFFPSAKWEIGVKSSVYHSPEKTMSSNFLLGAYASYKTKRVEYQLSCRNLLNNTHYNQYFLEGSINSYVSYTLRPREFMAKIIFDL